MPRLGQWRAAVHPGNGLGAQWLQAGGDRVLGAGDTGKSGS